MSEQLETLKTTALDFIRIILKEGPETKITNDQLTFLVDVLDGKITALAQSVIDLEEAKQSSDSESIANRDLLKEAEAAALTIFSLKMIGHTAIAALRDDVERRKEALASAGATASAVDNNMLTKAQKTFFDALDKYRPASTPAQQSLFDAGVLTGAKAP